MLDREFWLCCLALNFNGSLGILFGLDLYYESGIMTPAF